MTDRITIEGTAGTTPQLRTLQSGRQVASLRVASTLRRQDPATGRWVDGGTSWYSVSAWGDTAAHVADSIRTGDPVLVVGRLRVATWGEGERQGTAVEVDADAIGHSLRFGVARYERRARASAEPPRREPDGEQPSQQLEAWAAPGADARPTALAHDDEPPF